MKSNWLRILSTVLVIALLINMLPMSVFAEEFRESIANSETVSEEVVTEDTYVVSEVIEKRTEYSKEFLLSNGLHMATVYADPVHYETDSGWEEIDNTLKTNTDGTYSNTEGIWDVSLPQQLSDGESVTIEKDGYTLSFSLTGELNTSQIATYGRDGVRFDIKGAKKSHGKVQKMDWEEMRQNVEFEEMVPEKSKSRLTYSDVYENTNIIYDLDSNTVKESIVLESYSDTLQGYTYTLEVGTMIPVLEEDGQITLYDESRENIVMVMPAPYLVDDAGEYNYDIEVQLTGSGSTYTLNYILPTDWLAAEDRAWPVIMDPWIEAEVSTSNISDVTVAENAVTDYQWGYLQAGYGEKFGVTRFYLMFDNLPALTSSDVVVHAQVSLLTATEGLSNSTLISVHKVNNIWESEGLTWSNKPGYNENIEDYAIVDTAKRYGWNITDIVRGWYADENTGMMFKASNEEEDAQLQDYKSFFSSDYYDNPNYLPTLVIYFRNNNGLESYWDYTTSTAGRAGTGYVNNFTGNMTWVHNDIGFGGNRMPVSINHVYNLNDVITPSDNNNSNDTAGNSFGMGLGWRTNYNQLVYKWEIDGGEKNYYIWEDEDGTDHYFEKDGNEYKDEDGLELTLTDTGSGSEKYKITNKYGECWYFDTNGRLTKIENNQKTKSNVTFSYYSDTRLITRITDGAGRKYDFYYTNGMLTKISFTGTGTTEISSIQYAYNDDLTLKSITYADGKTSTYSYTNKLLKSATDIDGYTLTYTYNTVAESWQPYRVKSVAEKDGNTNGGSLTFTYEHNQTTITDHNGNTEILQFNDFGNLTCIQDDEGRAQHAQYAFNTDADRKNNTDPTAKGNQLRISSELQYTSSSLMTDGGIPTKSGLMPKGWNLYGDALAEVTLSTCYADTRSIMVDVLTGGYGICTDAYTLAAGETHTFSCYVKPYNASVYLKAVSETGYVKSKEIEVGNTWKRIEVTYTNNTNQAQQMQYYVLSDDDASMFYVDCAQLENAHSASRYNLLDNGDFNAASSLYRWTCYGGYRTKISESAAPQLDGNVYKVEGDPTRACYIKQTVRATGKTGATFILSGWGKGNAAPIQPWADSEAEDGQTRDFALQAVFNYKDGTTSDTFSAQFNTDTDQWQYTATAMVAEKDFSSITVTVAYNYNVNTAYFDGIQLIEDEFGDCFEYDEDGNVTSVLDANSEETKYNYDDQNKTDLLQMLVDNELEMTYDYDEYHNVISAESKTGLTYTYVYDKWGNNTSVSINDGTNTMTSTATYTSDGNYLVSTTDAMGQVTSYGYNAQTGVLDWVQYPNDTEATRTEYDYDTMFRLASAAVTTDTGNSLSAAYTYTDDLLTSIQTGSTTYNFDHGVFGLRTGISVGDRDLATYTYTNDKNFYLEKLEYGNDDSVEYEYDKKGRVTKKTYEDDTYVTYTYGDSGCWTTITDSATGITTTYTYDYLGRLRLYEEKGTNHNYSLRYSYTDNKLTYIQEIINGYDRGTRYTYDEDDRLVSVLKAGSKRTYNYDDLNRVNSTETTYKTNTVFTTNYSFTAPTGNTASTTSTQISSMQHTAAGYNTTYSYTYDKNGNILTVSDGTYTTSYEYDSANQLIRENNPAGNYTYVWEYDNAGNILSRTEYQYTTGEIDADSLVGDITYQYNDSQWGDLLTSYNGRTITYDDIGNPLNDGTWNYTWQHGRQLASMSKTGTTWNYTYNADGMRTKRTNGTNTYEYVYSGSELVYMSVDGEPLRFSYAAEGTPMSVAYGGYTYFYVTNLQGDVVALLNSSGEEVVSYTYDAWGNILSISGTMATTLGTANPLRYRGYVYDWETGLYYVSSRYYDPEIGRFINADAFPSTGQGFLGNNMFVYCGNNPVSRTDVGGYFWDTVVDVISLGFSIAEVIENPDDPMAWLGVAADVASLVIPCVAGGGALIRAATKADDVVDAVKAIDKADVAVDTLKKGWNVGDDISNLTKAGNVPSWSTVRQRYWKNEALLNPAKYSSSNIDLMRKGRAPLVELNGKSYPMELHHIVSQRNGGANTYANLLKVTPWEHAMIDPFRHFLP